MTLDFVSVFRTPLDGLSRIKWITIKRIASSIEVGS
jgi:hypothetical protein